MPLGSIWRCLDAFKASSGERLGGSRASSGERFKAPSWQPLESLGGLRSALGAIRSVSGTRAAGLKPNERRLGRSLGHLGAVLGLLEAMLEPFGKLPRPFWTRPNSSWQHVADLLNFLVFLFLFPMMFIAFSFFHCQLPGMDLRASWRSWMQLEAYKTF